jgi:hypothetical protein
MGAPAVQSHVGKAPVCASCCCKSRKAAEWLPDLGGDCLQVLLLLTLLLRPG